MPKTLTLVLAALALSSFPAQAEPGKVLESKFAIISYSQEQDISQMTWRIGGNRLASTEQMDFAKTRIDEIVVKVEGLLDLYPQNFRLLHGREWRLRK